MGGDSGAVRVSDLIDEGVLIVSDGYRAKNAELSDVGLPFARAGNIQAGFNFSDADRFPEAELRRVGEKVSQPGDVVFTSKGTVGRFAFVGENTPRFVYSPQLCFWRSRDPARLHPRWLFYWMQSQEFAEQYLAVSGQTDMAAYVNLRDQKRMAIRIPAPGEQRAIAHILGTLDDKIELNRRMSETLEAMARALFTSWFVDFDPVRAKAEGRDPGLPKPLADLFPDSFQDSELGEIPKGWEVVNFGFLVEELRDRTNPSERPNLLFRHFSIPAYDDQRWPKTEPGSAIKSQKSIVPPGVVLLSKLNPEIPRVWLVDVDDSDDRAVCSTEFLVLRPIEPVTAAFIYCLCTSPLFRQQIESLVTGTSKSHQRARPKAILGLNVIRPPGGLLDAFDQAADPWLRRSFIARRESHALAALRDTLLPKLISGELRVKATEKFIGMAR